MADKQTFTKLEIADILFNFTKLLGFSLKDPDKSFQSIAVKLFKVPSSFTFEQYYNMMTETFIMYLIRKYFVSMYDVEFPYLKEQDIDAVKIPQDIFVNQSDYRCFSKKQIIKFIRNALCHNNDEQNEIYKLIVEDSKIKFEIQLQNVQPRPFYVKIDGDQLSQIMFSLFSASKTDAVVIKQKEDQIDFNNTDIAKTVFENISYRHVYAKISPSERAVTDSQTIIDKAVVDQEYRDFPFLEDQAKKIQEDLEFMKDYLPDVNGLRTYVIKNVMPLGVAKKENLEKVMCILGAFMIHPEKCMNDFFEDVKDTCLYKPTISSKILGNYTSAEEFVYACKWDLDSILAGVSSIFFEYMFSSFITDEKIMIDGVEENTEKIRNAFIHSRWFLGKEASIHLMDWQNGDRNEMNLNWSRTVTISQLMDVVEQKFNEKIASNQKNNT